MKRDMEDILLDLIDGDIDIDKAKEELLFLDPVSHCPLCNSDNLHQYKLHHVHCKDCKEDFNKSCG